MSELRHRLSVAAEPAAESRFDSKIERSVIMHGARGEHRASRICKVPRTCKLLVSCLAIIHRYLPTTMKLPTGMAGILLATMASGFQPTSLPAASRVQPLSSMATATINIQENAQRDVFSMEEWARNCGVQTAEGFQLTSQDGVDYSVVANQNMPVGSPVLFAPAQMILSSSAIQDEMGGNLEASENALANLGETNRLPLFRLMVKILAEYENGDQSPYFPWLNALPRLFYNGVAMTDACFECLPPYVSWLSQKERNNYAKFLNALRKGYSTLSQQTLDNDNLIRWAYNVALTRHQVVVPAKEKKITPLADMLNHGTNPNCEITYDPQGNCMVTTTTDVAAGSPLTISLGDPSNPSPLFATYGFLDTDCPTVFCKACEYYIDFGGVLY